MGLPIDLDKAFGLYFQAAKAGHMASCYRTAMSCEIGIGTKRDPQKALQFYRKAASLGDVASMYKLGTFLYWNDLTSRNNYVERITGTTSEYKGSNNMA
jgi:TPR repeat protein